MHLMRFPGADPTHTFTKGTKKRQSCVGVASANCTEKIKIRARHKIAYHPPHFSVARGGYSRALFSLLPPLLPSSPGASLCVLPCSSVLLCYPIAVASGRYP